MKKHARDDMNEVMDTLYRGVTVTTATIQILKTLAPFIDRLSEDAEVSGNGGFIWIKSKHRSDFAIIREAFHGMKWNRYFASDDQELRYYITLDPWGIQVLASTTEIPPSCELIVTDVKVPERMVRKFELRCKDGQADAEGESQEQLDEISF